MDELVFQGLVAAGAGLFARELEVPGRAQFPTAPDDWPDALCRGTLNFRISELPKVLQARGWSDIKGLDRRGFSPVFEIPQDKIVGNTLQPSASVPENGRAQVWRARLEANSRSTTCWVLRRINSGYGRVLELVSDERLRDTLDLATGTEWPAMLRMYGLWRTG
ncbi:hypothetical protein ACFODL_06685 [Phenylobacterium terrae]|uniref:Uncharacterized protein n=1 Tax=Phenylobacterium terrae TaxID=2665495 RepID=A0ABW4N6H0_9CAUL